MVEVILAIDGTRSEVIKTDLSSSFMITFSELNVFNKHAMMFSFASVLGSGWEMKLI
jgi:hypothetical protein